MSATYLEAIDELFKLINDAWIAGSAAIVTYVPDIEWPGVEPIDPPLTDRYWARVSQKTIESPQTTLSVAVTDFGKRRYQTSGLLFMQIFAPLSDSTETDKARQLAVMMKDALRAPTTASCIRFFNAREQEVGVDDRTYQINVVVEYQYDDIG